MTTTQHVEALVTALAGMLDTFDHPGLRGLALNAKRHGWTAHDVDVMQQRCRDAHTALDGLPGAQPVQLTFVV